jgi:hypothetical protein
MVGLFCASLAIAGAFAVVIAQQKVYGQQAQVQSSQQGLWVSMDLIQRDLRKAGMGFGTCMYNETRWARGAVDAWSRGFGQTTLRAVEVWDNVGTDGAALTGTDVLAVTFTLPPGDAASDTSLAVALPRDLFDPSTTSFSVSDARGLQSTAPTPCQCTGSPACPLLANTPPFPLALVLDPTVGTPTRTCSLVQLTSATACDAATLTFGANVNAPWNRQSGGAVTGRQQYQVGDLVTNLGALAHVTYYVDAQTVPGRPRLVRDVTDRMCAATSDCTAGTPSYPGQTCNTGNIAGLGNANRNWCMGTPQVLAEGIEDLQLVAACDVDNNGAINPEGATPTAKLTDEWFFNAFNETVTPAGTTCWTFSRVRVSLVSRSLTADAALANQGRRPALENHDQATVTDNFYRRVQSTTTVVPNLGI